MSSACPNKTPELLQCMPGASSEISAWFDTLTDRAFDTVCVSAVTVMLREEQDESGFISATSIARCTRAVRDRYRQMRELGDSAQPPKPREPVKMRGVKNGMARLNEWQVRIARRVGPQVRNCDLAEMFDVNTTTVQKARSRVTWRHLSNDNGLSFRQHRT